MDTSARVTFPRLTAILAGLGTVAVGGWAMLSADSFIRFTGFPPSVHYVHDVGAFQLGIGTTLLLATIWRDALALGLAGFLVGNTAHAVVHAFDTDLGGSAWQPWSIGAVSVVVAAALAVRLRELGWVFGQVRAATAPALAPLVGQKTVLATTYRRDGTPVGTPVSIVVDGQIAYLRSYERAWKTRRIRNNPAVAVAPSTMRGKPTGPAIHTTARRLTGTEAAGAARAGRQVPAAARGAGAAGAPPRTNPHRADRPLRTHAAPGPARLTWALSALAARPASSSSSVTARQSP